MGPSADNEAPLQPETEGARLERYASKGARCDPGTPRKHPNRSFGKPHAHPHWSHADRTLCPATVTSKGPLWPRQTAIGLISNTPPAGRLEGRQWRARVAKPSWYSLPYSSSHRENRTDQMPVISSPGWVASPQPTPALEGAGGDRSLCSLRRCKPSRCRRWPPQR